MRRFSRGSIVYRVRDIFFKITPNLGRGFTHYVCFFIFSIAMSLQSRPLFAVILAQ